MVTLFVAATLLRSSYLMKFYEFTYCFCIFEIAFLIGIPADPDPDPDPHHLEDWFPSHLPLTSHFFGPEMLA